jgi:N-acetylmuramoyl-L-alanine amidase
VYAECIFIDIGHGEKDKYGGTIGATGHHEWLYNRAIGIDLKKALEAKGHTVKIIENAPLSERVLKIHASACTLFISIHHDSVQPQLDPNLYSGYSIFITNRFPERNYSFWMAWHTANALNRNGFHPSLHHAEDIDGERKTLLDKDRGIYLANFYILRNASIPGILLECGIIANKWEAVKLMQDVTREKIVSAIVSAVDVYFGSIDRNSGKVR